jgi:hypothetical protein
MKVYVPHAKDAAQSESVYQASRRFCKDGLGWQILPPRIYSLRYRHDGREYFAQVGHKDERVHEEVLCIFESEVTYFVCTAQRGVIRGDPILVGREEISDIEYFDEAD